jgi:hypothetical protein
MRWIRDCHQRLRAFTNITVAATGKFTVASVNLVLPQSTQFTECHFRTPYTPAGTSAVQSFSDVSYAECLSGRDSTSMLFRGRVEGISFNTWWNSPMDTLRRGVNTRNQI